MAENDNEVQNTFGRQIRRIFIKDAKRILIIIIIVVLVVALLAGSSYVLKLISGKEDADNPKNAPAAIRNYSSTTTIDEKGINFEQSPQELWDELVKQRNDITQYLGSAEELAKILYVQSATENLYTGKNPKDATFDIEQISKDVDSKSVQGIIKLKRAISNNTTIYMEYTSPKQFQGLIDKYKKTGNESDRLEVLKHFTIDENGNVAKVARYSEEKYSLISDDPDVENVIRNKYDMETQEIDYKAYARKYTMPFNYLWSMLLIGEDKDFVFDLAELVYNSELEITVRDSETTTTVVRTKTYKKIIVVGFFAVEVTYTTTETTINIENTLNISLTLGDIWFVKYEEPIAYEKESYSVDPEERGLELNGYDTITCTEEIKRYITEPATTEEKTDKNSLEPNFITIFIKNRKARLNILSARNWLFTVLERNYDTANFVDLTKYLFYKTTGTDYGITEFETSWNNYINGFSAIFGGISGIEGNAGIVYDFLLSKGVPPIGAAAIMGNIQAESGFLPNNLENGANSVISDEEFTNNVNSQTISREEFISSNTYGLYSGGRYGYGLAQWTDQGRKGNLYDFAKKYSTDFDISNINMQLDFFWQEVNSSYTSARDVIMSSTEESQLQYATTYWGKVYEGYEFSQEEADKRYQYALNWYNAWQESHTFAGGELLEVAKLIHDAEKTWKYSTGSDLFWWNIEKSLNNPNKVTCCATYVNCVLYSSGYASASEMNNFNYNSSTATYNHFKLKGWQEITSYDQLQPGDIVFMYYKTRGSIEHVQIYAGNDTWFNAGSTEAIRRSDTPYRDSSYAKSKFIKALRPAKSNV